MRVGLVGSQASPDLRILRREIEDRGHKAAFINLRKFPQYVMAGFERSSARSALAVDHADLLDFACFYVHDLEGRDGFFRGEFGPEIWAQLRDRYLEFARCEADNLAFTMGLVMCLGGARPMVNRPEALVRSRFRPSIRFRLARAGIPLWPLLPGPRAWDADRGDGAGPPLAMRIRIVEEFTYDVPCFPRRYVNALSLLGGRPEERWRSLVVKEGLTQSMIRYEDGREERAALPREAAELAGRVISVLDLDVAEVHLVPQGGTLKVLDVLPFPWISDFEEITGEGSAAPIAERILSLGGSK
ncbi:MAG: hypothetical protein V1694_08510 [Candidatus Eisenbacteria bacterium]